MNTINILISGAGFVNKGAEAMLRTVQSELSKRLPETEFHLWRLPEWDCKTALASGLNPLLLPFESVSAPWNFMSRRCKRIAWSVMELLRTGRLEQLVVLLNFRQVTDKACFNFINRKLKRVDCFLDISGFAYGDAWNDRGFQRIRPIIDYCRKHNRPAIFLPQAWGSFEKPLVLNTLRNTLSNPNTVFYSRDETSCRHLEKALDKPLGSISASPDIVFRFQGGSVEQGKQILREMGCSLKRPIIGISPNMKVYERVHGTGSGNLYLQALVKLVNHCLEKHDIDIVLQANEIDEGSIRKDDRYLCSHINAAVNTPDRCFMTRQSLTSEATMALIGRFDYLVSSRFHSLVFGFSQGVPSIAVSWSHKYRELLGLFGMENYVQECRDIDPNRLISMFEQGWVARHQQNQTILDNLKNIHIEIDAIFDATARKIHETVSKKYA